MFQFMVTVEGRLAVRANDPATAKEIVKNLLAARQPWLKVAYNDAIRIGHVDTDLTAEPLSNDGQTN